MLNFHVKLLDQTNHRWHNMALVQIQHKQCNKLSWCCCSECFENFLNLLKHCTIVHLCILLTVLMASWKSWKLAAILLLCLPLKMNIGGDFIPSAHTVTTRVAYFFPVWRYRCWLSLHLSSPKFVWRDRWRKQELVIYW